MAAGPANRDPSEVRRVTDRSPEQSISAGVDRYRAVVDAQRKAAEELAAQRAAQDQDAPPTVPAEEVTP